MKHTHQRRAAIVADDDSASAAQLQGCLDLLHYEVVTVSDTEAVRAAVSEHPRALVLAAASLPGLDAAHLCREVREKAQQAYVILLAQRNGAEAVAAPFEAGADDVITKPLIDAELRARLQLAARVMKLEEFRARLTGEGTLLAEIAVNASLHSRRYLEVQLFHELDRARRFAHPLALILAEVNPALFDERLLRAFGTFLCEQLRMHVDWVARYADQCFAIVLPETGLRGALCAAQRLRETLCERDLVPAGLPTHLSGNFGVAALDEIVTMDLPRSETLMKSAETYLRRAVRNGPNHIAGGQASSAH